MLWEIINLEKVRVYRFPTVLPLSAVSYLNYACSVFCSDQLKLKHSNLKKSTTCPDPLSRYYPWDIG